jgi:hypothetical protein
MDDLSPIGRTRDLTVLGYGASELEEYLRRAAAKQDRVLVPEPTPETGLYYRSDHCNLANQGVPMLCAKAGIDSHDHGADYGRGWLEDYTTKRYHKPSDEYDPRVGREWHVAGPRGVLRRRPRDRQRRPLAELARGQRVPRHPRQQQAAVKQGLAARMRADYRGLWHTPRARLQPEASRYRV